MKGKFIGDLFDPDTSIDDIVDWACSNLEEKGAISATIRILFSNSHMEESIITKIELAYSKLVKERNLNISAVFGFFLFCRKADNEDYIAANDILSNTSVRDFFYEIYAVKQEYRFEHLYLHRTGTTSYILKNNLSNTVIKTVKYTFFDNYQITEQTRDYSAQFITSDLFQTPSIYFSCDKYIIMEYINGLTLSEYLDQFIWSKEQIYYYHGKETVMIPQKEYLNIIAEIFSQLSRILKFYSSSNIYHFDLSPHNILIKDIQIGDRFSNQKVYLIDFGYNYLLKERVGSNIAFAKLETYVAPELIDSESKGSIKSDIYSIGILLLEAFSSIKINKHTLSPMLDEVWNNYSGYAKLIEELIDENPNYRLMRIEDENIYQHISNRLQYELDYFTNTEDDFDSTSIWSFISDVVSQDFSVISKLRTKRKLISNGRHSTIQIENDSSVHFSLVAEAINIIIISLFTYLVFYKKDYDSLPGLIVSVSFSLIATRYYLNIFAGLSVKKASPIVNFYIRINSFIYALPILWTMLYDASDWAYCSAIGVFLVAFNNHFTLNLSKKAHQDIGTILNLPTSNSSSVKDFLIIFRNWPYLMFIYGFGLIILGVMLDLGIAQDEFIYAIIVAVFVNIFNMYYTNCTRDAPLIRVGLDRLFFGLIRAKEVNKKPSQ